MSDKEDSQVSDELEQRRKEKIESFHVHFEDDTDDISSFSVPEETDHGSADYSIDLDSGREAVERDPDDFEDFDSGTEQPAEGQAKPRRSELRAAERSDRKRRRIKAKKNQVIFRTVWLTMIIFTSVMLGEYLLVGINDMFAIGREDEKSVSITIPKDADLDQITDILIKNHVIQNEQFFKLFATVTKSTTGYTQGTFDIQTNKDYLSIINYMQSNMNRTDVVTLQFREGLSIIDLANQLEEGDVCSADDFLEKCNSDEFDEDYEFLADIRNVKKRYYKLEGYLFPDTYDFYVGEDVSSVVRKFLTNYRRKLYYTKIRFVEGEKKQTVEERAKQLGISMEEVINLASLIQAEAADAEDMYVISSILQNRLATIENGGENENGEGGLGYLQLDSTVYYPYRTEQQVPASIRGTYSSPYNTYKNEGLPFGPICNPGLEAIQAAVNPDDTDYYYFCHKAATEDEPAVAYYAKTNYEHLANQEEAGLFDEE